MYDAIQEKKKLEYSLKILREEVGNLLEHKKALLKQISQLNKLSDHKAGTLIKVTGEVNTVKDITEKAKADVEAWKDEQFKTAGKDLEEKRAKLDKKSDFLAEKEKELEATASQNALERVLNKKTREKLKKREKSLLDATRLLETREKMVVADESEAKEKLELANKERLATRYAKNDAVRERDRIIRESNEIKSKNLDKQKELNALSKSLAIVSAKLKAKEANLQEIEKGLEVKRIRLESREATLARTVERLKKQGVTVI